MRAAKILGERSVNVPPTTTPWEPDEKKPAAGKKRKSDGDDAIDPDDVDLGPNFEVVCKPAFLTSTCVPEAGATHGPQYILCNMSLCAVYPCSLLRFAGKGDHHVAVE